MRIAIVSLLLLAVFAPITASDVDLEAWSANLKMVTATYGDETWKYITADEVPPGPAAIQHAQNESASYQGALGLHLTMEIEIAEAGGASPTTDYGVTALIPTDRGPIPAVVDRNAADPKSFKLHFDVDGTNHADWQGRLLPALSPGTYDARVTIYKRINDVPSALKVGDAHFNFTYVLPYQEVQVAGMAAPYIQDAPDSLYRLFTDIGWDRSVRTILQPLNGTSVLNVTYDFDAAHANKDVGLSAYLAKRPSAATGAAPPTPAVPFVPGVTDNRTLQGLLGNTARTITIDPQVVGSARTDAYGRVTFALKGSDILAKYPGVADGVVVLAPLLGTGFTAAACPAPCKGAADFPFGATELVLPFLTPAKDHVDVVGFGFGAPDFPVPTGLPGSLDELARAANTLEVYVKDPSFTGSEQRTGDAWAFVADGRSTMPLSAAPLAKSQREDQLLMAELPLRGIQAQRLTHYRILGLVYGPNDVLTGYALADRGFTLDLDAPPVHVPPGAGGVYLNFTSRTTNFNGVTGEPQMQLGVRYQVALPDRPEVLPVQNLQLDEGSNASVFVPITNSQEGGVTVRVNATTGDIVAGARHVTVEFLATQPKQGLADKIPGFELAPLALGLVLVALWRRRQ